MPTIAAINARRATLPQREQLSNPELRAVHELWESPIARVASDFRALLNSQTSDVVASTLRGMGSFASPPDVSEQTSAVIRQLQLGQAGAASHVIEALNGLSPATWREAANGFNLTGATAIAADAKQAFDIVSAVERMQLPIDSMTHSLASVVANATRIDVPSPVFSPYPLPAIHIRREPLFLPADPRPIAPSTQRLRASRIGRPRGSYDWYPERVVQTYEQLRCSGRHVTQERLAMELGVTLRTLQRWLTPEHMDLGWPPTL